MVLLGRLILAGFTSRVKGGTSLAAVNLYLWRVAAAEEGRISMDLGGFESRNPHLGGGCQQGQALRPQYPTLLYDG